jgi:hypothetical protein
MPTLLAITITGTIISCSSIAPGQDPLVVRTEQAEGLAYNTFDEFLKIDDIANANTSISNSWQSAHVFAQYLRKPMQFGTNGMVPFGIATVLSLDNIKLAYKAGTASSNTLTQAIGVLTATVAQANQYKSLIGVSTMTNVLTVVSVTNATQTVTTTTNTITK